MLASFASQTVISITAQRDPGGSWTCLQESQRFFFYAREIQRAVKWQRGYLRYAAGDHFEALSAGIEPKGLNPLAIEAPCTPDTTPTDSLFPNLEPEWVSVAFSRVCRTVNIADFRFHDLRHTAASWMRMKGADIHTVALLLGHKDLRMAARYQHLSPAYLSDAVKRLDSAFKECHALCHQYVTAPKELGEEVAASA